MAQFSFDVVSEVNQQELTNAIDQARREIAQRFDFKNTGTEIKLESDKIEVRSNSEGRVQAAVDVIKEKMVRRDVSLKALQPGKIEPAASGTFRQELVLVHGITDEKARTINKFIKALGTKAQSQVQGEQLRISSKSKDELQKVMQAVKDEDFGIPLQFTNYR